MRKANPGSKLPTAMALTDLGKDMFGAVIVLENGNRLFLGAFSSTSELGLNGPRVIHEYDEDDPNRLRKSPRDL